MSIENDKRGAELELLYADENFLFHQIFISLV